MLAFIVVGICPCDDVMSDSRDCGVGAVLIKPVGTQFVAVSVVDWGSVRRTSALQVS